MRIWAGLIFAGFCLAAPAVVRADGLSAQDDFSFRRVKAPGPGAGKRITVQIDPVAQARRLAVVARPDPLPQERPAMTDPAAPPASSTYAWFWDSVPTAQGATSGRFALAMATLSHGPGGKAVAAPRMQHMQALAQSHGTEILKATLGSNVSPALVLAVIAVESAGRVDAVSSAGATGLMQLIPATATRFGVSDSKDAVQNIRGGVAYLNWLMQEFDRDPLMVLAAYNAGEGAVKANAGVPPYGETRDYVPKVLAAWQVAQGLCLTPPELVSDPCVFKVIAAGG
ncbi:MAG: lytic transglycosylase domain-containing protein [Pseudorhodobacter sp.]|nr:lytic transglycosylase domain-containing protein [Pseudorhodobacter sp.]